MDSVAGSVAGASPEVGAAGCSVCSTGAVAGADASSDMVDYVLASEIANVSCAIG